MSERRTIVRALLDAGERWPDRGYTFVGEDGEAFLSFSDLARRAAAIAAALRRHGLRSGDRVALALPDTTEFVTTLVGCMYAGLIPVPMYPPLRAGTRFVFLAPSLSLRIPIEWLRRMSSHHATISFAPNFGYGLCTSRVRDKDLASLDLSRWRIAGCGAEPIQRKTLDAFAERFAPACFRRKAFLLA